MAAEHESAKLPEGQERQFTHWNLPLTEVLK